MKRIPIISDKQHCCPFKKAFGYIYLITNLHNGHMYVGLKHTHGSTELVKSYWGSGPRLLKAIDKYTSSRTTPVEESFSRIILKWVEDTGDERQDNEVLGKEEVFWIDAFDTFHNKHHYNMTSGGSNGTPSLELRKAHSNHMKELWEQGSYENLSETSKETITKLNSQPEFKEAQRKGASDSLKAKWGTPEFRNKMMEAAHKRAGKRAKGYGGKIVQADLDGNVIKIWECQTDASLELDIPAAGISSCCKGEQKTCRGFRWFKFDDYLNYIGGIT